MNNYGKTIHTLRVSHKMSQQELADGIFDRSTLSKIENGQLSTSYDNELKLASRLGVTLDEFKYISNNYTASYKTKLLYRFFSLKSSTQTDQIKALMKDCRSVTNDDDIKRIATILQALLLFNEKDGIDKAKKLLKPMWFDELKEKTPTLTDIYTLSTILFAVDPQAINSTINKIITAIDTHYPFMKSLKVNILINQAFLQMKNHKFDLAAQNLQKLKPQIKKLAQYDKLILVNLRIAICEKKKECALEQLNLLYEIGAKELADNLKEEINEFL